MGMLINGNWVEDDRTIKDGAYVRAVSAFKEPISPQTIKHIGDNPGRFQLIGSLSCPWSHRTMLTRVLKRIDQIIPLHIAGGPRTQGYRVGDPNLPWPVPGRSEKIVHLHELYVLSDPRHTGRTTVPVLWDGSESRIVSNESIEILRGLDKVRPAEGSLAWTLSPVSLRDDIETLSSHIQTKLSNAVYRAGKAQRQDIYEVAVDEVFSTLGELETRLAKSRFLMGDTLTETDLRLWPTLARFDAVYVAHFKCGRRRLIDYDSLWGYARDIFSFRGVASTFDETAIRSAYYGEDLEINPFGIVAAAPLVDWNAPHDRERLGPLKVATGDKTRIEVDPATFLPIGSGK